MLTGDSYDSLATRFCMGMSTVHYIVKWTCSIIWQVLSPIELKAPDEQDWKRIERKFATRWNFPNCCGALDGKHVVIQAPARSGSLYYNYKGTFSLVLMALVDADYRFFYVDTGDYGSNSDNGIFKVHFLDRPRSVESSTYLDPRLYPTTLKVEFSHTALLVMRLFP